MSLRCQQKCDRGSQCTRIAGHADGYHLTEHGCVCLTDDVRTEINEWFTHVAPPDPFTEWAEPARPTPRIQEGQDSGQDDSDAANRLKEQRNLSIDKCREMVDRALSVWDVLRSVR